MPEIKTNIKGQLTLVDKNTGEVLPVIAIEKNVPSTLKGGWRRVYLEQFMEILSKLYSSGRKIDVVEFILDNLNYENKFTMTQAQVAKALGVSNKTIVDTFKVLRRERFLKKTGLCYTVSPEYICATGSDAKNANILLKIREAEEDTLLDDKGDFKDFTSAPTEQVAVAEPAPTERPAARQAGQSKRGRSRTRKSA